MRTLLFIVMLLSWVGAARIKDVAGLSGLSDVQLVGYGLVVGLPGTGDGSRTQFTVQSVANMLKKMGIEVPPERLRLRNVAAVMVTADLAPFVKPGKRIDITLSSLGDARSLEGGTLLMTPLQASDGEVFAVAQGSISVGGEDIRDNRGRTRQSRNHTLSGNIPGGALVQQEIPLGKFALDGLRWVLHQPDFTSAVAMATAINTAFPGVARAEDASSVFVQVPANQQADLMSFIARTEGLVFTTSTVARVVLNERTGTLVAGADVRISEVAVSHGSVVIQIEATDTVSQPAPLTAGTTVTTTREDVEVQQQNPGVRVLPAVSNAGELAQALNSLGVSPRDIITIFQAIKRAGALHADLVIM